MEIVVIQRACQLVSQRQKERLEELNREFSNTAENGDRLALYRVDRSIHRIVDESSKNPYAVHALEPLRFFEQRVHYLLSRVYPETGDVLNQEHMKYIQAIIDGRSEAACDHFKNMVTSTTKLIKQHVDAQIDLSFVQIAK